MENGITNTWVNINGKSNEKEIVLKPDTFVLDVRSVDWFDLMYSLVSLETGTTIPVMVLYPEELTMEELAINVRSSTEQLDLSGIMHTAFVCDVGSPAQVHYVSEQGQLLKVERPYENITIELKQSDLS